MPLTVALILAVVPGSVRATENVPHVAATVVARAQVLSGVRVGHPPQTVDAQREADNTPRQKPRERPCPEREATPCRLMVLDMP